ARVHGNALPRFAKNLAGVQPARSKMFTVRLLLWRNFTCYNKEKKRKHSKWSCINCSFNKLAVENPFHKPILDLMPAASELCLRFWQRFATGGVALPAAAARAAVRRARQASAAKGFAALLPRASESMIRILRAAVALLRSSAVKQRSLRYGGAAFRVRLCAAARNGGGGEVLPASKYVLAI
ncbi:hypothetical protein NPIL_597661, partial [Nephila pilipes]